jgi:hypothetical protein
MRILLTVLLPLLLPTLLYVAWLVTSGPSRLGPAAAPLPWRDLPWIWLIGAGAALVALMFYAVGARLDGAAQGVYVPPKYVNGEVIPGHLEPAPK